MFCPEIYCTLFKLNRAHKYSSRWSPKYLETLSLISQLNLAIFSIRKKGLINWKAKCKFSRRTITRSYHLIRNSSTGPILTGSEQLQSPWWSFFTLFQKLYLEVTSELMSSSSSLDSWSQESSSRKQINKLSATKTSTNEESKESTLHLSWSWFSLFTCSTKYQKLSSKSSTTTP